MTTRKREHPTGVPLSDEHRAKIQATKLIERLQKNAHHEKGFMTKDQIRSAEILLKKALPDLKSMEV